MMLELVFPFYLFLFTLQRGGIGSAQQTDEGASADIDVVK